MSEDVSISGLKELDQALRELPVKLQRNVLRSALRASAKVVADEAKRMVPVRTGALRDSIRVTSRLVRGVPTAKVVAGSKGKNGVWYAHLIEFGTKSHIIETSTKKSLSIGGNAVEKVMHPGAQKKPFMRPAFDLRSQDAIERFKEVVRARLTKAGIDIPDTAPEDD